MADFDLIMSNLKKGEFLPIYLLNGEEPYMIDKIAQYIEQHAIAPDVRDFNQHIVYGPDTRWDQVVGLAKQFPVMTDKQLVMVKEAGVLLRNIDQIASYCQNPNPGTILVIIVKNKKIDGRLKVVKNIKKNGLVFTTPRIYDNKMNVWVKTLSAQHKLELNPMATELLISHTGTNLYLLDNELSKIALAEGTEAKVTPQIIEKHVGISKDFNVFELTKSIGQKDYVKAQKILNYFAQNPRSNPTVVVISQVVRFFCQVMDYHGLASKDKNSVAKRLGVNPYFVGDYSRAAAGYSAKRCRVILQRLHQLDAASKGVGVSLTPNQLYKTLLTDISL